MLYRNIFSTGISDRRGHQQGKMVCYNITIGDDREPLAQRIDALVSPFNWSVAQRLAAAVLLSGGLWLAVAGALGWWS